MNNKLMKRTIIIAIAAFALLTSAAAFASDSYSIDAKKSSAKFFIRKLAVAGIRGNFSDISGTIAFSKDDPAACSLDLVIGVASLSTGKAKQDKTMKSDDYFDAGKYPDMKFRSTRFKKLGEGKYEVTGDFYLHGVKKTVSGVFETGKPGGEQVSMKTQLSIMRSDFGIKKNIPAVGDKVKIDLSLVAVRK